MDSFESFPWKLVDLHTHLFSPNGKKGKGMLVSARVPQLTDGKILAVPEVYFIFSEEEGNETKGHGNHRHTEKYEIMVAVSGTISVQLFQDRQEETIILSDPKKALLVPPGIWHHLSIPSGAILGVLSSTLYDPTDVIEKGSID